MRGGATHLILSDERVGPDRAAIPMILATGAVHVHLLRQQLRTFTSLNVRSRRMPGRAPLRGADRASAPPRSTPTWRRPRSPTATAAACSASSASTIASTAIAKAVDEGLLKVMTQDGHRRRLVLSRRREFRGARPVAHPGRRILPEHAVAHFRHRHDRHPEARLAPCTAAPGTGTRSRCRSAASTSTARAARPMPGRPTRSTPCNRRSPASPTRPSSATAR